MSERQIIEKKYITGGGSIESQKFLKYEAYLVEKLREKLTQTGFEEKFPKHSSFINKLKTIEDFNKFADEWGVPRLEFEIK
jgi:hypothetical protein